MASLETEAAHKTFGQAAVKGHSVRTHSTSHKPEQVEEEKKAKENTQGHTQAHKHGKSKKKEGTIKQTHSQKQRIAKQYRGR